MRRVTLDTLFIKTIDFLEKTKVPYVIIGGVAVGILGEARATQDIDLIISLRRRDTKDFLTKAKREGFDVVDVILASVPFEKEAFKRSQRIELLNRKVPLRT